ncbi:dnaJ homolog subfamily C member 21 [Lutzomyia longipalpis]|uniref:DnaJ homolog subfamily C member 21 n=1 Tax=Lutzomyia longipalpis TaxID=7200 RepID=A0A1B0CPW0_LUTLO|nr:dnaJ homolog subfamily C member 21 [Lutzomyia longipalpis]
MKCHYEVLNLERTADEAEIKAAYRKQALRWHPDKNLDNPDGAKTQFQLVQQAYEVLSDPHERAWYDNHREQILRGRQTDYEDNSLDVFQYFTVSCFRGYGDDPGGFYAVYGEIFEKLASEEIEFLDTEEEFEMIPKFGTSTSDYEEVVHPFYAYWQSFCTKKSYAWLSPHDINEIRDRRILKAIEKENKKVQQKARRERNEEIRNLVGFVRKRDKRVQAYRKVLEERLQQNRAKQAESQLEQLRRRNEEIATAHKNAPKNFLNSDYEEQLKMLEKAYLDPEELDEESGESDEEEESLAAGVAEVKIEAEEIDDSANWDEFYCVACNKTFKNQSSYRNHESSKKHKENVQRIKQEVQEEEEEEIVEPVKNCDSTVNGFTSESDEEEIMEIKTKAKANKRKKNQRILSLGSDSEGDLDTFGKLSEPEDDWEDSKRTKAKSKPSRAKPTKAEVREVKAEVKVPQEAAPTNTDTDTDHTCVTCNEKFSSKNKLFTHLKKTNHGVYIPKSGKPTTSSGPKRAEKVSKRKA